MRQKQEPTPLEKVVKVLDVAREGEDAGQATFKGESLYFPTKRIYGGQIIAQSIMAGAATVPEGRVPNSIHGYFIRTGSIEEEVGLDVTTLRDGRSFSSRRVDVAQSKGPILTTIASYQEAGQHGVEFADPMPADLPDPENLTSAKDLMRPYADKSAFADYYVTQSAFDIRHVGKTVLMGVDKEALANDSARQMVWSRTDGRVQVSQTMNRAMLALECDQIMMEPALRRSGLGIATKGISFASIDHSMWWYEDIDLGEWHLYVQDAPVADHGRSLCVAKVYTQEGALAAVMVQEAMIRIPQGQDGTRS